MPRAVVALAIGMIEGSQDRSASVEKSGAVAVLPALVEFIYRQPGLLRAESASWVHEEFQAGKFPPRIQLLDEPAARLNECERVSRGWMIQLENDAMRAVRKIAPGPKASTSAALMGHCLAARVGMVMNACNWGHLEPQPAKKCLEVNVGGLYTQFVHDPGADQSSGMPISRFRGCSNNVNVGKVSKSQVSLKPGGNQVSGGSWQQFVAWVPSGASLQQPQPWKPLAEDCIQTSHSTVDVRDEKDEEESEEGEYPLLEVWTIGEEELARMARKKRRSDLGAQDSGSEFGDSTKSDNPPPDQDFFLSEAADKCTLHPHSTARCVWDLSSLVMVVYDMIMIPMSLFALPSDNVFLITMQWCTRLFWSFDMIMSCITGVVLADGSVQRDLRYIIGRYLRLWFWLDLFIVGSDWIGFILTSAGSAGSLGRFTRVFRAVRAVRLLRLARMREVIDSLTERIHSEFLGFAISLLKIMVFIIAFAHVAACLWWGIGARSDVNDTWVNAYKYFSQPLGNQYLMSLHWALSQYSGGMDEVTPQDSLERFYAVFMWIFTFMAATIVVSSITSNLTQMHIVGGSHARQMATLRKYLTQNSISSKLILRIQRSAQHALSGDLTPDVVELLPVVSEPLRVEMHFEMYSDCYRKHPFFEEFIYESPVVMRRVCHYATSTVLLSAGDTVFSEGESPASPKMFFVMKGALSYVDESEQSTVVREDQWAAEGALWTTWQYRGTLTALGDVRLAELDAKTFQELNKRFRNAVTSTGSDFDPKMYAARFVKFLNSEEDITDLSVMCDDY